MLETPMMTFGVFGAYPEERIFIIVFTSPRDNVPPL